jgi:hypothetical protein
MQGQAVVVVAFSVAAKVEATPQALVVVVARAIYILHWSHLDNLLLALV